MNTRKRKVIESSLELFIEKGFQHTSIQDILERANISKGTFYNYFSSKTECVLAILEQARYEANLRRHELLIGKDKKDLNIFAEQVMVLMKINKEQNLLTLFEGLHQSSDCDLKKALAHHRLYEIEWLMERFADIFGEEAVPYTFELAIIFLGMFQHLAFVWHNIYDTPIEPSRVVNISLRNIKALLPTLIEDGKVLLGSDAVRILTKKLDRKPLSKEQIVEQIQGFILQLVNEPNEVGNQLATCLAEEFSLKEPRIHVIEALLKPFREAFHGTMHESESIELGNMMWQYIKPKAKKNR